jgi:integrase
MKTVQQLVDKYYTSNDFSMLRDRTKKDYQYFLGVMCDSFGDVNFDKLSSKQAKHAYEEWVVRGISFANHICTVSSIVFRYAIDMEYAQINPFASVRRKTPPQRKVVWTEEDVRQFLDTAYGEFQWRSIGLIVHMAYDWCQRLGDMRLLTWDNFDFANRKLSLEQSKRRSQVTLPIEDDLYDMLIHQEQDFGFQQYVVPRTMPVQGQYQPYSIERLSKAGRAVMREAGLSEELRLMDLRRTGTTQMVEAGVSMGQIMSVTGHSNPQSVKPYMKNTYASANNALTTRKAYGKST